MERIGFILATRPEKPKPPNSQRNRVIRFWQSFRTPRSSRCCHLTEFQALPSATPPGRESNPLLPQPSRAAQPNGTSWQCSVVSVVVPGHACPDASTSTNHTQPLVLRVLLYHGYLMKSPYPVIVGCCIHQPDSGMVSRTPSVSLELEYLRHNTSDSPWGCPVPTRATGVYTTWPASLQPGCREPSNPLTR
jgi:hypothetical protein